MLRGFKPVPSQWEGSSGSTFVCKLDMKSRFSSVSQLVLNLHPNYQPLSSMFATFLFAIRTCSWEITPPSLVGLPGNSRAVANHPDRRRQWSSTETEAGEGGGLSKGSRRAEADGDKLGGGGGSLGPPSFGSGQEQVEFLGFPVRSVIKGV